MFPVVAAYVLCLELLSPHTSILYVHVCVCVCALVHAYICTPPCLAPPSAVSGRTVIAPLTLRLMKGANPSSPLF